MRLFTRNPIVRWRETSLAFEEAAEIGLVGEAHQVGNGLNGEVVPHAQQCFGLADDRRVYPPASGVTCLLLDDGAEIFRRKTCLTGIELHITVSAEMFCQVVEEQCADAIIARRLVKFFTTVVAE